MDNIKTSAKSIVAAAIDEKIAELEELIRDLKQERQDYLYSKTKPKASRAENVLKLIPDDENKLEKTTVQKASRRLAAIAGDFNSRGN